MNRRTTGILAAIVLALVGTVALAAYVQSARNRAVDGERMVGVWIVTEDVEQGTPAADIGEALEHVEVPARVRPTDAVTDLEDLDGLVTRTDLLAGEQLLAGRFVAPGELGERGVPDDLLQVTVELTADRALGGRVEAGDTVGVLLSFAPFEGPEGSRTPNATHLTLHKVPVTAVAQAEGGTGGPALGIASEGEDGAARSAGGGGDVLVTLAVDAASSEQLVFAAEFGGVWLADEPAEASENGTREVQRGNVYEARASS